MPNLFAMSFEGELAPSFNLRCLGADRVLPDGWGIGFYPGGEPAATVLKEPAPPEESMRSELVREWEHLESSVFVLHIRTARWGGVSAANTQPFTRAWGRRDWLMAHSGSLRHRLAGLASDRFEPVGSTDTERIFCDLMGRIAAAGWRALGDADLEVLHGWLAALNDHGGLTLVLTDGTDLCGYADRSGDGELFVRELRPPYGKLVFGDDDLEVDLTSRGIKSRKGVMIASTVLESLSGDSAHGAWRRLEPGNLLLVRQGAPRAERTRSRSAFPAGESLESVVAGPELVQPLREEARRLRVHHRTVYRYDRPVERSSHVLRLFPVHDRRQTLLAHELTISVGGRGRDFEDVFGNRARRLVLETPYRELVIDMRARVETLDVDPLGFRAGHVRSSIPLVWMPWQRTMLDPYLLPPELPESELAELAEYAMSFVRRNDSDLVDTLLDINQTIFREYQYKQGTTTLATTAFETYEKRRGVCQDFTNLFICLARLLGVPARYVCGYLYTGPKHLNRTQSEASHAWLQVYLPGVGWKGFDPTNGVLTQTNHIRVAAGRNYLDVTPTSGTIYVGGGRETLEVHVEVEIYEE